MVELAVFRLIRRLGGLWIVFLWFRGVFRRFCMIFHRFRTFRVLERTHLMTNSGQKYKSIKTLRLYSGVRRTLIQSTPNRGPQCRVLNERSHTGALKTIQNRSF